MRKNKAAISLASSAIADLQDSLAYYDSQAIPEVGQRLVAELLAAIELLATQPVMGRKVPEFDLDFLRELIRPPFRIVYRHDPDAVRVVRVWRSERLLILPEDYE